MVVKERRHKQPPNRIRELRLARGYSLQEVADALALSVSTVHRYEMGERALTVGRLQQFARHFECGPGDLLAAMRKGYTEEEDQLLGFWRQMSAGQRAQALQMLALLIEPTPPPRRPRRQRLAPVS